jgi:osmotically-inducible protein OsmY
VNRKRQRESNPAGQIVQSPAEVHVPVGWNWGARTVLAAAAILAAACVTAPPRSPAQTAGDRSVADSIYAALDADPTYFYRHVDVRVEDGVADLSGYVWSTDAIYRALEIARQVSGVTRVVTSHLELEREGLTKGRAR